MTNGNGDAIKAKAREIALKILSHVMDTGGDFPIDEMLDTVIDESGLLKALEASAPGRDWPSETLQMSQEIAQLLWRKPCLRMIRQENFVEHVSKHIDDYFSKYRKPVVSEETFYRTIRDWGRFWAAQPGYESRINLDANMVYNLIERINSQDLKRMGGE